MRKPVVDYRQLRPSKLKEPEYRHLLYLLGWLGYFLLYFLTENLIPAESCHPVHCALDDVIPFCEVFIIPYTFWYIFIVGTLLYFVLYNTDGFKKLQTMIIIAQVLAMVVYIVYPTRQDLRPEVFQRENLFTWGMGLIYGFDTSTGVCPSLHVAISLNIASAWTKEREVPRWWKAAAVVIAILISISTAFVKQHSVVDIIAALPLALLGEIVVYGKSYWLPKLRKAPAHT